MRNTYLFSLLLLFLLTACTEDSFTPVDEAAVPADVIELIRQDESTATAELSAHEAALGTKSFTTIIPAGSSNALAAAIAAAPRNGVIRLEGGDHTQSGTLVVDKPVNIVGEKGARLLFSGIAPFPTGAAGIVPAIHVRNTEFVRLRNLVLVPVGGEGGTAILVQEAPYTFISLVTAEDWQNGVIAEQSRKLYVERSVFVGSSQWQSDPTFPVFGVVVVNGPEASIFNNTIRNTVFGVWACDRRGRLGYNTFTGNVNGIELCKVPVSFPLPDGQVVGSDFPATRWLTYHNEATSNFNNGIEVIDGANRCLLVNNRSTGNGALDYEFAGPTGRYGFPAPTSVSNRAFIRGDDRWADCGEMNFVRGGEEVEDWTCF